MHRFENEEVIPASLASLSKRAARRLVQRAFVLVGRDRHVRQQIREQRLETVWILADWNFEWTVHIDHGRIEFDRRAPKKPDLILTWKTAGEFFLQAEAGGWTEDAFERAGEQAAWKSASPVVRAFFAKLESVLRNPVDENGVRLV